MTNKPPHGKRLFIFRVTPEIRLFGVLSVGFCLCLNLLSCGPLYTRYFSKPQESSLSYLKGEFGQIRPFPGAVAGHQRSMDKGRQGHVGADYTSAESFEAIKAHYNGELTKRGWKLLREEKVLYNNRDYGGLHVFFCKNNYTADLQFAGEQEQQFGWTYSFSLSWGLYDTACS